MGSLASCIQLCSYNLVDQRDIHLDIEDLRRKIEGAGLAALWILDFNSQRHHAPALFRTSDGTLFDAVRSTTFDPLTPGIAPFTKIKFFSASTE